MWKIFEHRRVDKQLKKLPLDILKKYEKWKDIVSVSGRDGLALIKGFRDETLRGEWTGYRSSRLSRQYRVIYQILNDELRVNVIEVNPHDYRRK